VSFRVTILPPARSQLLEQALWWSENRSAEQAYDWLEGFEQALASLSVSPERCSVARESDAFNFVLRELRYGLGRKATHRAVFEVRDDEVIVYSIRHLAQRDLTPDDVKPRKPE
jgi:plasmid stabilization system protein ParE